MGIQKKCQAEDAAKLETAAMIADEAKVINVCGDCNSYIDLQGDITDAYKKAANLFKNGDPRVDSFSTQIELTDFIKEACDSAGENCSCKNIDDWGVKKIKQIVLFFYSIKAPTRGF